MLNQRSLWERLSIAPKYLGARYSARATRNGVEGVEEIDRVRDKALARKDACDPREAWPDSKSMQLPAGFAF